MERTEIVKIDTEIAELDHELAKVRQRQAAALDQIHRLADDTKRYIGRRTYWVLGDAQAEQQLIDKIDTIAPAYRKQEADKALASLNELRNQAYEIKVKISSLQDVWASNGRWSRFFLVQGGHIHRSTNCQTLRPTTSIGWLPELSGLTEKDAVAEHGAILCTICFPSAPVEWTNHYELQDQAKADSLCPGSKTYHYDRNDKRTRSGYVTGNGAVCTDCGQWVTTTSTGKLRGHKKA